MEKILVTQGLNELKLLDQRITDKIIAGKYVVACKTNEKNVTPGLTKADFIEKAKANYQSVTDLIARRKVIKSAIVASNAVTHVTINGKDMTVAEAIERKSGIENEKLLLDQMKVQYAKAVADMNTKNADLEERINESINRLLDNKDGAKTKKEDFTVLMETLRADGAYSLVDPLGAEEEILRLGEDIEGFLSEVDAKLQISNCITTIEF